MGFDLSPPNHDDHVDHMPVIEAISIPVADVPYNTHIAATVEII